VSENHRSVYMMVQRERVPEVLNVFDFPDPNEVVGERAVTNVPAQALFMMNNPFVIKQSEYTAEKLLASGDNDKDRVERAYLTIYSRKPNEQEAKAALEFIDQYTKQRMKERSAAGNPKKAAWTAFAQALFASGEFSNLR
jgi:hypothetical protein